MSQAEAPIARVLGEGVIAGLGDHTALVARDGTTRPIEDSAAPIRGEGGAIDGGEADAHPLAGG